MRHGADAGYRHVLRECGSDLAAIVEQSERVEKYRGFSGEVGFFRQSFGPGWALVGDAGYFKDPLTAHGITDALIDAELLAQAAAAGTETAFAGYQSARDKLAVGPLRSDRCRRILRVGPPKGSAAPSCTER